MDKFETIYYIITSKNKNNAYKIKELFISVAIFLKLYSLFPLLCNKTKNIIISIKKFITVIIQYS